MEGVAVAAEIQRATVRRPQGEARLWVGLVPLHQETPTPRTPPPLWEEVVEGAGIQGEVMCLQVGRARLWVGLAHRHPQETLSRPHMQGEGAAAAEKQRAPAHRPLGEVR